MEVKLSTSIGRRAAAAVGVVASVALVLAACGAGGRGGGAGTKLRIIGTLPIDSYASTALKDFKKTAEKESDGALEIETYPAQQLYSDEDAPNVLPNASVEMGVVNTDFWTGKDPSVGILMVPMLYESYEHFYKARDAMTSTIDKSMQKNANVKVIGWLNYSTQTIGSNFKVDSIDDFRGHRFRGWGEYSAAFFKYAGADSVVMSSSDVYDALSKGAIDGEMSAWVSQLDRKFYEVAEYMLDTSLLPVTNYAVVVNLDVWNDLSDSDKKVLEQAGKQMDQWTRKQNEKETAESIKKLRAKGVTVSEVDGKSYEQIRERTLPRLKKDYLKKADSTGRKLWEIVESSR